MGEANGVCVCLSILTLININYEHVVNILTPILKGKYLQRIPSSTFHELRAETSGWGKECNDGGVEVV